MPFFDFLNCLFISSAHFSIVVIAFFLKVFNCLYALNNKCLPFILQILLPHISCHIFQTKNWDKCYIKGYLPDLQRYVYKKYFL